jgi:hypothetical protein
MTARQAEYVRQAAAQLAEGFEDCSKEGQLRRCAQLIVRHLKTLNGCPTAASTGLPDSSDGASCDGLLRAAQRMYMAF